MNGGLDRVRAARILGVDPAASVAEIRRAYRQLASRWHPDRHRAQGRAAATRARDEFDRVRVAYESLTQDEGAPDHVVATPACCGVGTPVRGLATTPIGRAAEWGLAVLGFLLVVASAAIVLPRSAARSAEASGRAGPVDPGPADPGPVDPGPVDPGPVDPDAGSGERGTSSSASPAPADEAPRLANPGSSLAAQTFTLGSTRDDVRRVQGRPTSSLGPIWRYGDSRVRFAGSRVVGWDQHPSDPLRVAIHGADAVRIEGATFREGASQAEVAARLGCPESILGPVWRYGMSTVRFRSGRVVDIQSHPSNPLPVGD